MAWVRFVSLGLRGAFTIWANPFCLLSGITIRFQCLWYTVESGFVVRMHMSAIVTFTLRLNIHFFIYCSNVLANYVRAITLENVKWRWNWYFWDPTQPPIFCFANPKQDLTISVPEYLIFIKSEGTRLKCDNITGNLAF